MRSDIRLGQRYAAIVSYTGLVVALCGVIILAPLVGLAWYPDERGLAYGFLVPGVVLMVAGAALWRLLLPRRGPTLPIQDGGVIVLASWTVVTLASSAVFMADPLLASPTHALFEAVSAWTTTGLSVVDVEHAPRVILLWRSIMQLAGGAGMAIILVTLAGGPLGTGVTAAEGRGDQLVPHVRRSARLVSALYAGYALLGTLALRAAGMSWFDAVNHAFCAVSTGGFSTRAASIGHWDSALVETAMIPLMLLGSTNFQIAYLALRRRFEPVFRNVEVRTAAALACIAAPLILVSIAVTTTGSVVERARVAAFEVVSALTTTGFSTTTYDAWPAFGVFMLVLLMIVGGGTGSTAGAMKQYRVHVLAKAVIWELRRACLPRRSVIDTSIWQGHDREPVLDRGVVRVAAFAAAYLALLAAGSGVLMACGFGFRESLFEYASALGTVGLSVGVTSPGAPAVVLWAEIVGMLLGRLEIFIVVVALHRLVVDGLGIVRAHGR